MIIMMCYCWWWYWWRWLLSSLTTAIIIATKHKNTKLAIEFLIRPKSHKESHANHDNDYKLNAKIEHQATSEKRRGKPKVSVDPLTIWYLSGIGVASLLIKSCTGCSIGWCLSTAPLSENSWKGRTDGFQGKERKKNTHEFIVKIDGLK